MMVSAYFNLLEHLFLENNLFDKFAAIFNTGETGLQLDNKTGKVLEEKHSKAVSTVTSGSGEKGETVTVLFVVIPKALSFHHFT